MRVILGLIFIFISLFGILFFRNYNGSVIAYPILWYVPFIALGLIGVMLISSSFRKNRRIVEQHINTEIEKLKATAEKRVITFDKCEFKSGSFSHQVEDENLSMVKLFAPGSLAYNIDTTITENVIQSYLTYTDTINGESCKFISQSFSFDPTTLKFHVLNHNITLYVDRFDKRKYYFDLKR